MTDPEDHLLAFIENRDRRPDFDQLRRVVERSFAMANALEQISTIGLLSKAQIIASEALKDAPHGRLPDATQEPVHAPVTFFQKQVAAARILSGFDYNHVATATGLPLYLVLEAHGKTVERKTHENTPLTLAVIRTVSGFYEGNGVVFRKRGVTLGGS